MPESNERGALTEAVYYILLALHRPMHGYGIMQLVRTMSKDRVNLGPGTLYGAINTLLQKGWIESAGDEDEGRRKLYALTSAGRRVVLDEIRRLQELLSNGIAILEAENDAA